MKFNLEIVLLLVAAGGYFHTRAGEAISQKRESKKSLSFILQFQSGAKQRTQIKTYSRGEKFSKLINSFQIPNRVDNDEHKKEAREEQQKIMTGGYSYPHYYELDVLVDQDYFQQPEVISRVQTTTSTTTEKPKKLKRNKLKKKKKKIRRNKIKKRIIKIGENTKKNYIKKKNKKIKKNKKNKITVKKNHSKDNLYVKKNKKNNRRKKLKKKKRKRVKTKIYFSKVKKHLIEL